jgi:hypothetical protein
VTLEGASPSDGWSFERGDDSGDVEVTFRNGETQVLVQATCVGGEPHFQVESGSSGDTSGSDH